MNFSLRSRRSTVCRRMCVHGLMVWTGMIDQKYNKVISPCRQPWGEIWRNLPEWPFVLEFSNFLKSCELMSGTKCQTKVSKVFRTFVVPEGIILSGQINCVLVLHLRLTSWSIFASSFPRPLRCLFAFFLSSTAYSGAVPLDGAVAAEKGPNRFMLVFIPVLVTWGDSVTCRDESMFMRWRLVRVNCEMGENIFTSAGQTGVWTTALGTLNNPSTFQT